MAKMKRVTFTIPPELADDFTYLAGRLGVSRSALLAAFACEPIRDLRTLLEEIPEKPSEAEALRFRGQSIDLIKSRLQNLMEVENDLFGTK
jgi:hypothetical protein